MPDTENPFLPDKGSMLAQMLMSLGSGLTAAGARNQPFYMGIAPGARDYSETMNNRMQQAAAWKQAQQNYELQNSYKGMQEKMMGLQARGLQRTYDMQDAGLKMVQDYIRDHGGTPGMGQPQAPEPPPGIRLPQPPLMGPPAATPGAAQTGRDESGGSYTQPNRMGSGAYGKYQFMPETWADTAKRHPELGLPFDMRMASPDQQERAKEAFDRDNTQGLRTQGFQPTAPNLYLAQRFGATGAGKFLNAPDNAPISTVLPQSWQPQNPDLNTTVGQFKQGVAQRYGGMPGQPQMPGPPPDTLPLDMAASLGVPAAGAIAGREKALYGYETNRYKWGTEAAKSAREGANQAVGIGPNGLPVVQQAPIDAAAAKAAAEEKAKAEAHTALVLPAGWQNMSEKDLRAQMNPLVMASIDQLGKHEKFPSQIPARLAGANGPTKDEIMSIVPIFHPNWSPVAATNRETFVNYMQPDKDGGKTLAAVSNGAQHLGDAVEAFNEMNNGRLPIANRLFNQLKTQNGWGKEVGFDTVKEAIGTEVAKAIAGASDNSVGERQAHRELMDASSSPEQMKEVMSRYAGMFGKRLNTVYAQAKNVGLDEKYVNSRVGEEGMKALAALPNAVKQAPGEGAARPSEAPKPGFVSKGYRFIGGDPNQRINWTKIQ